MEPQQIISVDKIVPATPPPHCNWQQNGLEIMVTSELIDC